MVQGFFLGIVLVVLIPQKSVCVQPLTDYGIYRFQNLGDSGLLTNPSGTFLVITAQGDDVSLPEWQVIENEAQNAYKFKIINEQGFGSTSSMVAVDRVGVVEVQVADTLDSSEDTIYWSVIPVESNLYIIQNLGLGLCLESTGIDQPVTVGSCRVTKKQRWNIQKIL